MNTTHPLTTGSSRRTSLVRRAAVGVAALGIGATTLAVSAPAQAAELPDNLAKYANCPIDDPRVSTCIYVEGGSSRFKLGKWDLKSSGGIVLQFGLRFNKDYKAFTVAPVNGAKVFSAPALTVPGGLTGIPGFDQGPLAASGQPEIIGLPATNIPNLLQRKGTAFNMKLRAKVKNDFTDAMSGQPGCFIGSETDPIHLKLTTGVTKPPAPNQPIEGSRGTTKVDGEPEGGLRFEGVKMVENSFKTPGSVGCGPFGAFNGIVNDNGKIPSAAGTNSVELTTTIYQVDANVVRAALGK